MDDLFSATGVAQGGALVVLAGVLFYGLKVALPLMLRSMENMQNQIELNTKVLARLAAALFQHDATVRGVNPDTLGTTEEMMERVLS